MTFQQKIDKILSIKRIKLWKLGVESGLNNTLEKAYTKNREMREKQTDKFLQNLNINPEWWNSGRGDVFLSNNNSDQTELNKKSFWDEITEGDYIGLHKSVWAALEDTMKHQRELMNIMANKIPNA